MWLASVAFALVGLPPAAAGQEAEPLTKTELVRFLSGGVYTTAELATLVRRSCLSFEPTDRDRSDLRSLGADDSVMEAIEWCTRPLDVNVEPAGLTLGAGRSGSVTLRVSRDGQPVGGVGLALVSGAGSPTASGVTDDRGLLRLPVSAGGRARSFRLPVRATGANLAGDPALAVRVVPGPPRSASLSPPIVQVDAGADTAATVHAALRDGYGNPVVDVPVSLTDPETGFGVSTGRTTANGDVELRIVPGAVVEDGPLELRAEGLVLGELAVRVRAAAGRDETAPGADPGAPDPGAVDEDAPTEPEIEPDDPQPSPLAETGAAELESEAADPDTAARAPVPLEDARALAAGGETDRAITAYEAAIEDAPRDVAIRLELARVLDRADRLAEARSAYREVIALAPGNVEASRALARLDREGTRIDASLTGGATLDGSPGLRAAEIRVRPLRFLRVWGRYDRSLALDGVPLIRGPDEIEGYFGGVALSWGADRLFTTSVEVGRRVDDVSPSIGAESSLDQNTVRVEQHILVPAGRGWASVTAGGYLGRWFDRDDWLAWARVRVPVADGLDVGPAVYTGETVGTNTADLGRAPERETRIELPIRFRSAAGWFVEPAGALGWIEGADDEPTRRLYEARLLAELPIADGLAIRAFVRHQDAPGIDAFTLGALGLHLRFD